jgi:hypothetical protein
VIDPQLIETCAALVAPAPTAFYVATQLVLVAAAVATAFLAGLAVMGWRMSGQKGRVA